MEDKVQKINVFDKLFNEENVKYIIPLYQRAFAWEESEISQLIEDIDGFETENYFLGTLVVAKKEEYFEVIDGQQRLTALYLLFHELGITTKKMISFECREKSNYTLENLTENIEEEKLEPSILRGIKDIKEKIKSKEKEDKNFLTRFKENLKKVQLYRIIVPENTDLNRYFEIMNTRGEQLELQDVLKAKLMSMLEEEERQNFSKLWDACSDMNGYLQMHFNSNDRKLIFGSNWEEFPNLDEKLVISQKTNGMHNTIEEIIEMSQDDIENMKQSSNTIEAENGNKVRFESIINFPYFLLHALRVFVEQKEIKMPNELGAIDDKKLVEDFNNVIESCNKKDFAREFIKFLIQLRYLLDQYIIKREFSKDDRDGQWSLMELRNSENKKLYPVNTDFKENLQKNILMIQACLRVTYITPKNMNWITKLLGWLYKNKNRVKELSNEYLIEIEKIAKEKCREFLEAGNYNLGVDTPHIVFNYLDYLLWITPEEWENSKKYKRDNFVFEFRNSVEHWYPQNTSKDTFKQWTEKDELNNFGNLCLIQREVNSKFSNAAPSSKLGTYKELINKGSLKLKKMAELIEQSPEKDADEYWRKTAYKEHGRNMINILKKACDIK